VMGAPGAGCAWTSLCRGNRPDLLDMMCKLAIHQRINFLWRPRLRHPDDEMVLEVAAAAGAGYIVTHNVADSRDRSLPSIRVVTPAELLRLLPREPS